MNDELDPANLLELTGGKPPQRLVSLVPSLTESLFDLGLGAYLSAVTDYCIHPGQFTAGLERIGGTKNPDIERIIRLQPDLVLANREENTRQAVEALTAAGIPVWLSFPKTVYEMLEGLWKLVQLYPESAVVSKLRLLNTVVDWARESLPEQGVRYFCPIWMEAGADGKRWWMTFNRQTYAHDVLRLCGGENVFGERERRYPLAADIDTDQAEPPSERDTRYPRLSLAEIIEADPQVVLLPSEPFAFSQAHLAEMAELLRDTSAGKSGRMYLVDGSLITWHGTRVGKALQELPQFFMT